MKNESKIVVIPSGNASIREFRVNGKRIFAIVASVFTAILVVTIIAVNLLTDWLSDSKIQNLTRTNNLLQNQIALLNGKLDSIAIAINNIYDKDDDIRLLMDLPQVEPEIRKAGVGGAKTPITLGIELPEFYLDDYTRSSLVSSYEKIQAIERQVKFELQSYAELNRLVKNKKDSLRYLPAIFPAEKGRLTDGFGVRRHPITGRLAKHDGLDIAAKIGTKIYASADGVVQFAGRNGGYGKSVFIDHLYGFQTRYAHMHKMYVKKGQKVKRGDIIGEIGNSGRSTGPHLHYEVRYNNVSLDPKDFYFDSRFLK